MNHILLFEPNQERVPQLIFLLSLADIRCTVATTIEEALNWLSADRLKVIQFDLFLLGSLEGIELEKEKMIEISSSISVPIVSLQRENSSVPEFLSDGIAICHPDNLLSCLQKHFVSENKQLPEERVQ